MWFSPHSTSLIQLWIYEGGSTETILEPEVTGVVSSFSSFSREKNSKLKQNHKHWLLSDTYSFFKQSVKWYLYGVVISYKFTLIDWLYFKYISSFSSLSHILMHLWCQFATCIDVSFSQIIINSQVSPHNEIHQMRDC